VDKHDDLVDGVIRIISLDSNADGFYARLVWLGFMDRGREAFRIWFLALLRQL